MTDHVKTLESLLDAAKVYPSGFSMPRLDIQLMQREADAIRDVLEERKRLLGEKEGLIASKYVGPDRPDLFERIVVLSKWSGRWKKLAQFRGWPASQHERTRKENKRLRERETDLLAELDSYRSQLIDEAQGGKP